jgi:hypothetical protein
LAAQTASPTGLLPAITTDSLGNTPRSPLVAQAVVATTHYCEMRERGIDLSLGTSPRLDEEDLQLETCSLLSREAGAGGFGHVGSSWQTWLVRL